MRKTQKSIKYVLSVTSNKLCVQISTKKCTSLSRAEREELHQNNVSTEMPWFAYISLVVGHRELSTVCGGKNEPTSVRSALASLMLAYAGEDTVYEALRYICDSFCECMHRYK